VQTNTRRSPPSPDRLTTETNWLLDVGLRQDAGSLCLWDLVNQGGLRVSLPALCLAEAVKSVETKGRQWRSMSEGVRNVAADVRRSELLAGAGD
jgi:hypothetical protein